MTVAWQVYDRATRMEAVGYAELVVCDLRFGESGRAVQAVLDRQSQFWRRTFEGSVYEGRRSQIRFDIRVRTAEAAEWHLVARSGAADIEMLHRLYDPDDEPDDAMVQERQRVNAAAACIDGFARRQRPRPVNYVCVVPSTGSSAVVMNGTTMFYGTSDLGHDVSLGTFVGAHEIGHCLGFDDLYDQAHSSWCSANGCQGNLMFTVRGNAGPPSIGPRQIMEASGRVLTACLRTEHDPRHLLSQLRPNQTVIEEPWGGAPYYVVRHEDERRGRRRGVPSRGDAFFP